MSIYYKSFIFNIIIWLFATAAPAENYRFGSIKTNDGLSDNQVNCIHKDSKGFIWLGNRNGLNRFDGNKVKVFQHSKDDSCSIPNNYVLSIEEARDGRLWIRTFSGVVIFDPTTEKFNRNIQSEFVRWGNKDGELTFHCIDSHKNVWLTGRNFLYCYDVGKSLFSKFPKNKKHIEQYGKIQNIVSQKKRYWIVYDKGFIEERDYQTHRLITEYNLLANFESNTIELFNRLFVDSDANLWIYSMGDGIAYFNRKGNKWTKFKKQSNQPSISSNIINQITEDKNGLIWIATDQGGLNIYNKKAGSFQQITYNENNVHGISHNSLQCVYCDNMGIMWIGTFKQGLNFYHPNILKFETERASANTPYSLPFNDVNVFLEDKDGNLWLGSNGSGLARKDKLTGKFTIYKHQPSNPNSLPGNVIVSLKSDVYGRIWIGTYLGGLSCFDGRKFTNYTRNTKNINSLSSISIWDIVFEPNGNMWLATLGGGVDGFDPQMKRIAHLTEGSGALKSQFVMSLTMDFPFLIISSAGGVDTYNLVEKRFDNLFDYQKGEKELVSSHVNLVFKDSRGLYWTGTLEGLNCYNPQNKKLELYTEKDGLPDNVIQTIVEDENSDLWISTVKGVCQLHFSGKPNDYKPLFVSYNDKDGLENSTLNYKAAIRTSQNRIYFGGVSGVNYFDLNKLKNKVNEGNIVFTNFQIYNQNIVTGKKYDGQLVLEKSITEVPKITLLHSQNFFSIEFAALNYYMPQVTHYLYKLDGFNSQWIKTNENSSLATFTNLSPGKYTLTVKAVYKGGAVSKNEAQIQIVVLPPWWLSGWAKFGYFLLVLLVLYAAFRQLKLRIKRNNERMEAEKEHKLDEMKLQFFTNISHEFRTPLTLILTPLENLINQTFDTHIRGQLEMMRRNANQLLTLVNQVLDFRKLEITGQELVVAKGDIVDFTKELFLSFNEAFEKKQISARFSSLVKSLWVNFDSDKFQKILVNLLSNALKFTPEGGEIKLDIFVDLQYESKKAVVRIDVTDTGIGIADEYQQRIFDSFYQVPQSTLSYQGSGIGLNLVKKYIDLMGGTIELKSEPGKGSMFSVIVPLDLIESLHNSTHSIRKEYNEKKPEVVAINTQLPLLLLVEDNDDVRSILRDILKNLYQIVEAENGQVGLEKAQNLVPDLIISDLMMPVMDGMEMCKALKTDIRTSHIPILMLTAKVSDEAKIQSLLIGIEDYITKPFNMEALILKVQNIKNRQRASQQSFQSKMEINTKEIQITSLDEKLIQKAISLVEQNIANAEFSVEELSSLLNMSRVNLYKKLLAITGKSPIEFIRIIRLKRSIQLLEKSQLSISEIAYEVGFNTPRYFSRYFKEEYKLTPTEFRERLAVSLPEKSVVEF